MLASFFQAVLPAAGQFCLFLLPEARHVWVDSQEKLVSLVHQYGDRGGIYYATAAYETRVARSQANVLAVRSLRLDIDAGPDKHEADPDGTYPSQRDALSAFLAFTKATALVPSYIVSSGNGLHIYYCLDRDLDGDEWKSMAEGLRRLTQQHDLRVDPSVTCDSARILRPPGTVHSAGKLVTILKATGVVHDADVLRQKLGAERLTRRFDTSINEDTLITFEGPPSSALKVAEHCPALAEVRDAGGDVQEPFWRAMLGLVKHTVEAYDLAHEWSQGYGGYDEHETQRKLDAWATGPTTCSEFSRHTKACMSCPYQGKVKSPILLGRMTAPEIEQLPEEKKPAPVPEPVAFGMPWDGHIPHSFDVVASNGVNTLVHYLETEKESETGEMVPVRIRVPITHEIFWFSHWADSDGSDAAQITVHKWDDMDRRTKAFVIPTAVLASRSDMAKKLAEYGVQVTTDKRALQSLEHYAKAQMLRIKDINRRLRVTDRFGLRILDDGRLVALHGKYLIAPDGTISEASVGPALRGMADNYTLPVPPRFDGQWDAGVWDSHILPAAKRHVEFMRKNYAGEGMAKYQLAFMLGLASPLMAFVTGGYRSGPTLPANGLSVSLYEREGGRGKTTLMKAVMLAYGRPDELSRDQNGQGSTDLARLARLSMMGTMPASFDEMGRTAEKSVANLISAVANGTARERATKEGGLITTSKWALICLVATNRSQRDMVTVNEEESSAVQYRLVELDMNNMPDFDLERRMTFEREWAEIQDAAGALGAVVQRLICEAGVATINKLVMDCLVRGAKAIESEQEDRFQCRALAAMLALQVLLSKAGLAMFDIKPLVAEFKRANDNAKEYVKENTLPSDGLELLSRALHDLRPFTVITETLGYNKGPEDRRKYAIPLNESFPQRVEARYIKDQDTIYVSVEALRRWCSEHHIRDSDILRDAREVNVLRAVYPSSMNSKGAPIKSSPFNLLAGMKASTGTSVRCCAFSIHRLAQCVGPSIDEAFQGPTVVQLRPGEEPRQDEAAESAA